jgi:hypothetical protein
MRAALFSAWRCSIHKDTKLGRSQETGVSQFWVGWVGGGSVMRRRGGCVT